MRVIGLTGGIASGKSSVAALVSTLGIPVIDADQLARDVVMPGSAALARVADCFGNGVLDSSGALDRAALAEIVFAETDARKKLEAILHPAIKLLAEERLAELRERGEQVVFYMAPLLIEAGAVDRVDEIWVVYVDRETQISRLMARDQLDRDGAEKRIASQMPMDEMRKYGRVVIDNSGTMAELVKQVEVICSREFGMVGKKEAGDC
ncbi:MAG: dephospho-CoA kinase [Geobacter sp.]|nr:dephospho-CoA kinase [Geobacter sp.]